MLEAIAWGAVQRVAEAASQGAPFILTGFIVAAVLRRLVGHAGTRRLFGDGTWRSLPQAWVLGMLLPVCSLGVLPVMREMKRAGLSGGTILAFGLTAPLFNPLSVLYGLTLSEPFTIFAFALCSLGVVTLIGVLFDRLFPGTGVAEPEEPPPPYGIKRILATLVSMSKDLWTASSLYILVGLLGVALLNAALPKTSFQASVNGGDVWAPLLMTGVAIPAYATPMLAMSQLGMMFQHGNSVGAAFALLILGAGLNLGIILWMFLNYGRKRAAVWFALLVGVVLALGYGLEQPLHPRDVEAADHTHAFDVYCCPFYANQSNMPEAVWKALNDHIRAEEILSLYGLLATFLLGLGVKLTERRFPAEAWLLQAPAEVSDQSKYDVVLPNWMLGAACMIGLVIMSVAGCYAYYPDPKETLAEIYIVKGEVLSAAMSGQYPHAEYWIPIWDDWNRRLQVGVYLRYGTLSEYHRMKSRIVRDLLELLDHAMDEEDHAEVKRIAQQLSRAQMRLSTAYSEEL